MSCTCITSVIDAFGLNQGTDGLVLISLCTMGGKLHVVYKCCLYCSVDLAKPEPCFWCIRGSISPIPRSLQHRFTQPSLLQLLVLSISVWCRVLDVSKQPCCLRCNLRGLTAFLSWPVLITVFNMAGYNVLPSITPSHHWLNIAGHS